MTRAAILVRLSEYDGPDDPTTSPTRQLSDCQAAADRHGASVVLVAEDLDVSGSKRGKRLKRPGIIRIMEALPVLDLVIVQSSSRLARDVKDSLELKEACERNNVKVLSAQQGFLDGHFWTLLAMFDEMESDAISTRVKNSTAHLKSVGRWHGGRTPFGYTSAPNPNGPGHVLVPEPTEEEVVTKAAELVLAGNTLHTTAAKLNAAGYRNRNGKLLDDTLLLRVLTGPSIRGFVATKAGLVTGDDGQPKTLHKPLVAPETAVKLDVLLYRGETSREPQKRSETLLSGLLSCGVCSSTLHYRAAKERYECSQAGCGKVTIRRDVVEPHVLAKAEAKYKRPTLFLPPRMSPPDLHYYDQELARLGKEIVKPGADVIALAQKITATQERREEAQGNLLLARSFRKLEPGWTAGPYARVVLEAILRVSVAPCGRGRQHNESTMVLTWLKRDRKAFPSKRLD